MDMKIYREIKIAAICWATCACVMLSTVNAIFLLSVKHLMIKMLISPFLHVTQPRVREFKYAPNGKWLVRRRIRIWVLFCLPLETMFGNFVVVVVCLFQSRSKNLRKSTNTVVVWRIFKRIFHALNHDILIMWEEFAIIYLVLSELILLIRCKVLYYYLVPIIVYLKFYKFLWSNVCVLSPPIHLLKSNP